MHACLLMALELVHSGSGEDTRVEFSLTLLRCCLNLMDCKRIICGVKCAIQSPTLSEPGVTVL